METPPVFVIALLTGAFCFALGAAGPLVLRRHFAFENLHCNNEVAGAKFGALAAFYSVLLAFVVVVVWNGYTAADSTCQQEAVNCQNLFRLSKGLEVPLEMHVQIEDAIRSYMEMVINDEWPKMAKGEASHAASMQFQKLSDLIVTVYKQPGMKENPGALNIQAQMLSVYTQLSMDRNLRLLSSATEVPFILWTVLIVGALSALTFGCFFGSVNVYAQATMNAIVATILGLILLAIFLLDKNFDGKMGIQPHAFESILKIMEKHRTES
ncbi:MAG: hypothetical protein ACAI35_14350 [Candidatus Methylacidiphilales bacterium]|nr:hypothetical protein [Candidatus Methylacidiphilales bacterium]